MGLILTNWACCFEYFFLFLIVSFFCLFGRLVTSIPCCMYDFTGQKKGAGFFRGFVLLAWWITRVSEVHNDNDNLRLGFYEQ